MTDDNKSPQLPPRAGDEENPDDNEVVRASRVAKSFDKSLDKSLDLKRGLGWKTAAGIGIGSGAVIAALLYARSNRK